VAFGAALALGFVVIYIREMFSRTVQQRSILKYADIPFFFWVRSSLPWVRISPSASCRRQASFVAEQFHHLRTSLEYMGINKIYKKIVVITSSISLEGKKLYHHPTWVSAWLMSKRLC